MGAWMPAIMPILPSLATAEVAVEAALTAETAAIAADEAAAIAVEEAIEVSASLEGIQGIEAAEAAANVAKFTRAAASTTRGLERASKALNKAKGILAKVKLKEAGELQPVISPAKQGSIFNNCIFMGAGFITNVGLYDPTSLPPDQPPIGDLNTVIDTSRCSSSMGGFSDGNQELEDQLYGIVGYSFDNLTDGLERHVYQRFHTPSFFNNGQSALSYDLSTHTWGLSLLMGDSLRGALVDSIVQQVTEDTTAQILRAAQCHIKCLQLDSGAPFDIKELQVGNQTGTGSNLDLATFYPELELAKMEAGPNISISDIKPTMQCQ